MADDSGIKRLGTTLMWICRLVLFLLFSGSLLYWLLYNVIPSEFQAHVKLGLMFTGSLNFSLRILFFGLGLISLFPQGMLLLNLQKGFRLISSGELFSKKLVRILRKAALWSLLYGCGKLLHQWIQPLVFSFFDESSLHELRFSLTLENIIPVFYFLMLTLFSLIWDRAREHYEENKLTI